MTRSFFDIAIHQTWGNLGMSIFFLSIWDKKSLYFREH